MGVREHRLGKGTIAYRGEAPDYWRAKTDALPARRARTTWVLIGLALLVSLFAVSPIGPRASTAQVQSRIDAVADQPERIVLLVDGEHRLEAPVQVGDAVPPVGSFVDVTVMADGRVVLGHEPLIGIWSVALFLGVAAVWRLVLAYRLRDVRIVYR